MIRETGGAEDGAAVKNRQDLLFSLRHLAIPKFEMAAVFFLPILIKVNQNIDTPVELELLMLVEVGVDRKFAARLDLMQTAADIIRVGNDALDPGKRFQKLEHRAGIQEVENVAHRRREILDDVKGQLSLIRIVELAPA